MAGSLYSKTAGDSARRLLLLLTCLGAWLISARGDEPSEASALAAKSLLLALTRAGDTFVAVGDRGHIVLSKDNGQTWSQSIAPTRAMLTGVSFADPQHGWAVGHDGVILATDDGGRTWKRQDSGTDHDTVFLDVHFLDARRGFAVGAYGKFVETDDGGKTWRDRRLSDEDLHLNRIAADGSGHLYLAGEAGTLLISADGGKTWNKSETGYEGSFFGVCPLSGGVLVAYGLRSSIFVSTDRGETWEQRETEAKVLLQAGLRLRDGVTILAGQGGNFFISRDAGRSFHHWKPDGFGTGVADLAVARDGTLIAVGEAGAIRLTVP